MINTSFHNINRIEPFKPATKTAISINSFFDTLKTVAKDDSVTSFLPIVQSTPRNDVQLEVPHLINEPNRGGLTSLASLEKYYGLKT